MLKELYKAWGWDGQQPYVSGPGKGMNYLHGTPDPEMLFSTFGDARSAALCANEAYRVGYAHAQADMRRAMGIQK